MSTLTLYGHPFSSYTWKPLIALYEKGLEFEFRSLDQADDPAHWEELRELWPNGQFPVLEDDGLVFPESSIIIEHLDQRYPETALMIPLDDEDALDVRLMDRIFDTQLEARFQAVVGEYLPFITETPDQLRIDRAKTALATIYPWLEARMPETGWACGREFTLADCSAAPALFYADWVHPIPDELVKLKAYRTRLLARPSVARCVDDARPYRHYFPLGAPDRD
jgi:glutathione S-transferase